MAKTKAVPSFDEVLSKLGNERFDVAAASEGANRSAGAYRVSKYGAAAEIAPGEKGAAVQLLAKPGWLLGGEIARLVDRGYQKFVKTSRLEVPATADMLRGIHKFEEELNEAAGVLTLYNEAMGTTSDKYLYDRVAGRE